MTCGRSFYTMLAATFALLASGCSSSDPEGSSGDASGPAGADTGTVTGSGAVTGAGGQSDASGMGRDVDAGGAFGTGDAAGRPTDAGSGGDDGSAMGARDGSAAGADGGSGSGDGGGPRVDGGGSSASVPSAGCGQTPKLKNSPSTTINYNELMSASLSRRYILRYPQNYDNQRPYRLILAYHWNTGSASQVFDCNTESNKCYTTQTPFFGLWNLADNSTIFVAPDGIDAGWANTNGRDLTLTDDILKQVEADLCIDKSRVFATGFSYGGAMSATLGCQRAEIFRAVAVYAGGIGGLSGACTGNMPIAYYGATGTQDSGYKGGQTAVEHFAQMNGCTARMLAQPPTGGHLCVSYENCSAGHPVRWCPFDDIHTPSPRDKGQSMTWQPKEVWTFLTQF